MSMRTFLSRAVLVLAMLFSVASLYAQKGAGAEIKIKKIDLKDQVTPQFKDSLHGSQGAKERWFRADVEFDSKSKREWIGELEVRWLVAIETDAGKVAGLTQSITYLDVEDGRSHMICAYVSPKFFKRYLRSKRVETTRISVYVEFYVDGIRVAREERHSGKMPNNWFNSLDKMQAFPNTLLPKSKTPFAPMDFDYFEFEKNN